MIAKPFHASRITDHASRIFPQIFAAFAWQTCGTPVDYAHAIGPRLPETGIKSGFLAEFYEYLRFASVSAQPQHKPDCRPAPKWLVRHCERIGLETKLHSTAGHPIVVAKTKREPKSGKPHFMPTAITGRPRLNRWIVDSPQLRDRRTQYFRPRFHGQQRPEFCPSQGRRSLSENRHAPALRPHVCARRRRRSRQRQPGWFLKQHRKDLVLRCHYFRYRHPQPETPGAHVPLRGIIAFEIKL